MHVVLCPCVDCIGLSAADKAFPWFALQAVALMRNPAFQSLALGLLYHISQEERHRTMFSYTDAVPAMHAMLLSTGDLRSMPELIALAVNLTQNTRIAEVRCRCWLLRRRQSHVKIDKHAHVGLCASSTYQHRPSVTSRMRGQQQGAGQTGKACQDRQGCTGAPASAAFCDKQR